MQGWQSVRQFVTMPHIRRRRAEVGGLMAAAGGLQIAAAAGLAYVAGFGAVRDVLGRFDAPWLAALAGSLAISFVGYYFAYRGIYSVEGGPGLGRRELIAVVTAGFGGFLAHGGGALDQYALQAAGADKRDASVRVTALAGLEHGILGYVGSGAAIAVLALGLPAPPADFSVPWAVIPVPATAAAFVLAERYRDRLRPQRGWRRKLAVFLDSIHLIRQLILQPRRYGLVVAGMVLFWLADGFSAWAALALFGFSMNGAALLVGFGTGMVFTRRTGPLAGAGVLMLLLPVTIWYSGAPLATAIAAIFVYRVLSLWLPMPFALASLRPLRAMGEGRAPHTEGTETAAGEPSLRHRPGG
jgi:hypothetical protein